MMTNANIIGQLLTILIAFYKFKTLTEGNWQDLLLISGLIPGIISIVLCATFIFESPRFLLIKKKWEQAFEILNKIL